jgi:hypothetical protein
MVRTVDAQERTEERAMAKARIRGAARTVASAMERTFMILFMSFSRTQKKKIIGFWRRQGGGVASCGVLRV